MRCRAAARTTSWGVVGVRSAQATQTSGRCVRPRFANSGVEATADETGSQHCMRSISVGYFTNKLLQNE